ncbi:hypothetical protein [Streptomyces sp. NPDC017435]|uniref:hypothetical protein n=1 Tax=Streptomyces sp. NPDC017435 TaxID=3364995 RepID=UPI003787F35D
MICDGRGTPLKVITTAANVNDVTQTLALVDGIPSIAGHPGRPRRRPEALLGDLRNSTRILVRTRGGVGVDQDPHAQAGIAGIRRENRGRAPTRLEYRA